MTDETLIRLNAIINNSFSIAVGTPVKTRAQTAGFPFGSEVHTDLCTSQSAVRTLGKRSQSKCCVCLQLHAYGHNTNTRLRAHSSTQFELWFSLTRLTSAEVMMERPHSCATRKRQETNSCVSAAGGRVQAVKLRNSLSQWLPNLFC